MLFYKENDMSDRLDQTLNVSDNCWLRKKIVDFTSKLFDHQLYAKRLSPDSVEFILLRDGKLREHFIILRNVENRIYKYSRKNIYYAREFMDEDRDLTPEETNLLESMSKLAGIIDGYLFFTDKENGRHCDQFADHAFKYLTV